MCLMCERDEMLAAYRDYVAQRAAAKARTVDGAAPPGDGTGHIEADTAWAAGTWFEIKTPRDE